MQPDKIATDCGLLLGKNLFIHRGITKRSGRKDEIL